MNPDLKQHIPVPSLIKSGALIAVDLDRHLRMEGIAVAYTTVTKVKPTVSGKYWIRNYDSFGKPMDAHIVSVHMDAQRYNKPCPTVFSDFRSIALESIEETTEWYGPLTNPFE